MIDCTAPSALVEEYERFQPAGDPGAASVLVEATAAVAAHLAAMTVRIFNDALPPRSADAIAQYAHLSGRPSAASFAGEMAEYHRRALATNEPLAEMLRSKECLDEIAAASASGFHPNAAVEACARFRRAVAAQLVAAPGHPLAGAASDLLAAELLADRLLAAQEMHRQAAVAAAEKAAADERAAALAADQAADVREAGRLFAEELRRRGLPADLKTGQLAEELRERMNVLAVARRRLMGTRSDVVRLGRGSDRRVYSPKDLANSIGDWSIADLQAVIRAVDVVERGDGSWL